MNYNAGIWHYSTWVKPADSCFERYVDDARQPDIDTTNPLISLKNSSSALLDFNNITDIKSACQWALFLIMLISIISSGIF